MLKMIEEKYDNKKLHNKQEISRKIGHIQMLIIAMAKEITREVVQPHET